MFSVKQLFFKHKGCAPRLLCTVLLILTLCADMPAFADDGAETASEKPIADNMIRITADRLVTDTLSRNAEFIGHVNVLRNDMAIFSDRLKIYYSDTTVKDNQNKPGAESIKSIVAEGNVKITFDDQIATTQRAEWSPKDQTIVLTGPGSKIVSGKNSITGSTITLHQADNRITVEGGAGERVEAQIFSDDKGLSLPEMKP